MAVLRVTIASSVRQIGYANAKDKRHVLRPPRPWTFCRCRVLPFSHFRRKHMADLSNIKEHAEVIGADGVHVGTVDRVVGDRIKLTKEDGGEGHHKGHHHYISGGLVATVEDGTVRLSANADVAITFEEEEEVEEAAN
jgi:hypothetical protein